MLLMVVASGSQAFSSRSRSSLDSGASFVYTIAQKAGVCGGAANKPGA